MIKKNTVSPKSDSKYYYGLGRRKRSRAQVRLYRGAGNFWVNGQVIKIDQGRDQNQAWSIVFDPLRLVGHELSFDLKINLAGGGRTGQLEASRLGVARALVSYDPKLKPTLRKAGFLTRDPREVERKKPGLKKARRAPQWQKR